MWEGTELDHQLCVQCLGKEPLEWLRIKFHVYMIYIILLWYSFWTTLGGEDQSCSVAPFCSEYFFLICGPTPALLLIFLWVELRELSGQAWWLSKQYASTSATKCTQSRSGSTCRRRNLSNALCKKKVPEKFFTLIWMQLAWQEHGTLCFLKQWMLHFQVFHQRSPVPHTSIGSPWCAAGRLFGAFSRFWVYFPCIDHW